MTGSKQSAEMIGQIGVKLGVETFVLLATTSLNPTSVDFDNLECQRHGVCNALRARVLFT